MALDKIITQPMHDVTHDDGCSETTRCEAQSRNQNVNKRESHGDALLPSELRHAGPTSVNPVKVRGPTGLYAREAELERPSRVACDLLALQPRPAGGNDSRNKLVIRDFMHFF
jgi:hypothetical protein